MLPSWRNPGDYVTFDYGGESLFCIRGRDGVMRGFYNVCQHRAHELVSGEGNTPVVVCPYHAWTYELTGELRSGPTSRPCRASTALKICLTEVRTRSSTASSSSISTRTPADGRLVPAARGELADFVPHIARLKPLEWVEIPEAATGRFRSRTILNATTARSTTRPSPPA
jgi:nitrite reductase/ring-hydroxylating ferredoxin subunit